LASVEDAKATAAEAFVNFPFLIELEHCGIV